MPPTETSHRRTILIINGNRVTALADDDPPVMFEKIPLTEVKWGPDGTMYVHGTARKGGPVTIKVFPTSKFAQDCLRYHARIQADEVLDFEGSYGDPTLGFSCLLRGGKMTECPPAIVPNQTFEVDFVFEEIIPSADGSTVAPPPGNLS